MNIPFNKSVNERKPLGGKSYGHIAHLPGSRMGPADHACHEGQRRIATEKARDKHDLIIVQEKLDGSNVGDEIATALCAAWGIELDEIEKEKNA